MDNFNHKKQYTKYTRKVNDVGQVIDAKHINTIQKDIQGYQTQLNDMKDSAFEERVYTIFNNNYFVNSMFMDSFYTPEFIDGVLSKNHLYDEKQGIVGITKDLEEATMFSTIIMSNHGDPVPLNDFFLIANEKIPVGSSIKYFLEMQSGESWQILSNNIRKPLNLKQPITNGFRVRAEFRSNAMGESPELNGYAVLFFDHQVEENLGMTNPDLRRFPQDRNRF